MAWLQNRVAFDFEFEQRLPLKRILSKLTCCVELALGIPPPERLCSFMWSGSMAFRMPL
jgi:hypothetical protein